MNSFRICICLCLLLAVSFKAWATEQSAATIDAWVVDKQTGKPLDGVIVVAHWELSRVAPTFVPTMPFGPDPRGPLQLQIMETMTDAKGHFYFPAWGPLPVPLGAYLMDRDPHLIFFKEGYAPWGASSFHQSTFDYSSSSTRTSWVDGMTIKLKKFEGDLKAYGETLSGLGVDLSFATNPRNRDSACDWKRIPRMLGTLIKIQKTFRAKLIYSGLPDLESIPLQDECGSAREFLKEYLGEENNPPPDKPPALPPKQVAPPRMYGPPPGFVPPQSK